MDSTDFQFVPNLPGKAAKGLAPGREMRIFRRSREGALKRRRDRRMSPRHFKNVWAIGPGHQTR